MGFLVGNQLSCSLFELNWVPALGAADAALAAVPLPAHVAGRRRPEVVELLRVELKGEVEQCLSANIAGFQKSHYITQNANQALRIEILRVDQMDFTPDIQTGAHGANSAMYVFIGC